MRHVESSESFDFSGIDIFDLTAGHPNASGSVAVLRVPPGVRHPVARSSRSDKYYIALSGLIDFRVGDEQVSLSPRALLVIEKNEWFEFVNTSDETAELLLIHIPSFDLAAEEFR